MYELCDKFGISLYKFRQFLRELDIKNYQKLYKNFIEQQWVDYWKGILICW
jgi:hypothetical protein